MKNINVAKKFILSFGGIGVLFLVLVAMALGSLTKMKTSYEKFYKEEDKALVNVKNLQLQLQLAVKNVTLSTITLDAQKTETYMNKADNYMKEVNELITWFGESYHGDTTLIKQYDSILTETETLRKEILKYSSQNVQSGRAASQSLLMEQYNPKIDEAKTILDQFASQVTEASQKSYQESITLQTWMVRLVVLLSILVFVLIVTLAIVLTRSILLPIQQIKRGMEAIERGDLSEEIEYESKDELGQLAQSMRGMMDMLWQIVKDEEEVLGEMADGNFAVEMQREELYVGDYYGLYRSMKHIKEKLTDTLKEIEMVSSQLYAGSEQASDASQTIAQGATEQSSTLQELTAAIGEISRQVNDNAQTARGANEEVDVVQNEAQESNRRMTEMLLAMNDINERSNEIGKIIKTIEDIAFQTNILALNAAVEAARAGVAGKGFAVVADEVRSLANKSAEASKNTAMLIEQSLQAVGNGKRIADDTAQSLLSVVNGIQTVSDKVEAIAHVSTEHATSIAELTTGIEQVSNVVQMNSAISEEAAATSQELSAQSSVLKKAVEQFHFV